MEIIRKPKNMSKNEWENWLDKKERSYKNSIKKKQKIKGEK